MDSLLDYGALERGLPAWSAAFRTARPFPHIAIDGFLPAPGPVAAAFPALASPEWIHYVHYNEKKYGLNRPEAMPAPLASLVNELNGPRFTAWLERLSGLPALLPDPSLEGGGLHLSRAGGYLNIHADFTAHTHKPRWRRRLNLLLYLSPGWEPGYGGALELWPADMSRREVLIEPLFNRCVVFETGADTFHGHPDPLACPPEWSRRSLALYYFTEEAETPSHTPTNYRARPGGRENPLAVAADRELAALYSRVKRRLGLDDRLASRILRFLSRKP